MHIGLDFDNTIVSYDELFHKVALEGGWITPAVSISKVCVRDHLRSIGKEFVWTEMQGYVYGSRMNEAAVYPDVLECLHWAREKCIPVSIISHKTHYPILGKRYDLHEAARSWIDHHLMDAEGPLVAPERVYFEPTKQAKLQRIAESNCSIYVDDLPEILLDKGFPKSIAQILFDPDSHHRECPLLHAPNWKVVRSHMESKWQASN